MKRFHWPLQRLLDVTAQREQALRSAVLALSQEMALLRRQIAGQQAVLQDLLAEIGTRNIEQRMVEQEVFMTCSGFYERSLASLRSRLAAAEESRTSKTAELFKARASRKAMERLRGEALQRHLRLETRQEQKEFDEGAHIAFARKAAGAVAPARSKR